MLHFTYRFLGYIIVIFTSTMSTAALSQVTYDDVVSGAIKRNDTQPNQAPNSSTSVDQLLNNIYGDRQSNTNSSTNGNYNDAYVPPLPPARTQRQQSDYDNSPAASRFRATQQQSQAPSLSANNPNAAYEAVKRSQPYGRKRAVDLDDYSISEDDLLDATTDGVIDVNKIPDERPTARSSTPLGELCCPDGTSYYLGICTRSVINRNISTAQYSEYSPGSKVPGGTCQGYKPIPGAVVVNN